MVITTFVPNQYFHRASSREAVLEVTIPLRLHPGMRMALACVGRMGPGAKPWYANAASLWLVGQGHPRKAVIGTQT